MVWTEEREQSLRDLWSKNYSTRRIAIEMGGGLTRNAIIGKANRMGLPMRRIKAGKPVGSGPPPMRKRQPKFRPFKSPEVIAPPIVPVALCGPPGGICMASLTRHVCHALIGSERLPNGSDEAPKYCGAPALPGKAWCQQHFAIYTQPPRSRG